VLEGHEAFLTTTLRKGVVYARDTPNFIGNRIGVFSILATAHHTGESGLGFDEVDATPYTDPNYRAVREAVAVARAGYVATIGIAASRPSVAFGYVRSGEPLGVAGAPSALHARGFTEKPDAATAREYVASGEYRWNAGIFVARASVLLDHLARLRPALHDGLVEIAAAWDTPDRAEVLARVWPGLEKIAIDHAVAEPVAATGGVAVVPGTFGWDDVGDFNSLAALLPADDDAGSKVLGDGGDVLRVHSAGSVVVPAGDRVVALLGIDDVVVVDTPDALLVTTRARAQQVRGMVDAVRASGREDLL
jgi:mannose-1-phosphate guanylyltransferase